MHRPDTADPPAVGPLRALLGKLNWQAGGAAIAFATGLIALLFTLFPDLKPFTATQLQAHMQVRAFERGVTLDQWRWRVALDDRKRYAKLLAQDPGVKEFHDRCGLGTEAGYVFYVETDAEGFKRRSLAVRAALYNADTQERIPIPGELKPLVRVPIDAPTDRSVSVVWLWAPDEVRHLFARIELYGRGDHLVEFADSKKFRALTERELGALPDRCLPGP
jgi:hypothetical protein